MLQKLSANGSYLIVGRDAGYWLMYNQTGLGGTSNKFAFGTYAGGSWQAVSSTTSPDIGTWYHVVGVRDNASFKIYVNGTLENTATISGSPANGGVVGIGANTNQLGGSLNGYLADVRVVISANSSSLPYTSNFTPSTDRLTAITDTQLLACHLPYFKDGSTHNHAITRNGNVKLVGAGPHDKQEYSASSHLGSASFDGSGDYLEIDDGTWLTLGNGNFCFETWIYNTATSGGSQYIFGQGNSAGQANSISAELYINSSRNLQGGIYVGSQKYATSTGTIPTNAWTHVALVRNGGNIQLYINGTKDGENTSAGTDSANDQSTHFSIGRGGEYNGLYFNGNIADFRFVKGNSVHTGNFTPPTAPLTAITNTELFVQSTDAGIIDKSQTAESVQLFGDTKSSTDQYKYLSSSIYFDGNGDYLKLPSSGNFLAEGAWTQEMWVRLAGTGNGQQIGPAFGGGAGAWNSSNGHQWLVFTHSSGFLVQYYGTNNSHNTITIASSAPFTANTWHHWAISWDGTTLRFFLDGTLEHSTTSFTPNTMTSTHTELGRMPDNSYYSQAHYSDVRITQGLARYTSNFTAPTAALQG